MAVTYTSAQIVKERLNLLSGAHLINDTAIDTNIEMAEGIINAIMQGSVTYDATKHGLIGNTATALAAYMCITWDISQFDNEAQARQVADLLWQDQNRGLAFLADGNIKEYLTTV